MTKFTIVNMNNKRRYGRLRQQIVAHRNGRIVGRIRSANGFSTEQLINFVNNDFRQKPHIETIPIHLL